MSSETAEPLLRVVTEQTVRMKSCALLSPAPSPHQAPQPLSSSSVPRCPELDLSVTLSPDPKTAPQPCPVRKSQWNNQVHQKPRLQGGAAGRRNKQVCFEERVVVKVTDEHCKTLNSQALAQKQTNGMRHYGRATSQRVEPPIAAANAEPQFLDGAELNSTLALKAELESVQGAHFDSHKAVQETLQKSERTKILINSRATEGVNVSRSQLLFSSLVSVDVQEDQLISQALQDRLVLAPPTRNHGHKVMTGHAADCPSLLVFWTSDLQRQKPLPPEEEQVNNEACPAPVPCTAHLTFDLYKRQRQWEATP
ncbi:protein phosphatase 1 regulatory subunit 35 [Genypterus blacodes]|uniref:protein phosphatase 1 regulatory subunit 35 n=1 Tax=Genypterus blacodes TaxID=154954 RepID=UPI003F7753E4